MKGAKIKESKIKKINLSKNSGLLKKFNLAFSSAEGCLRVDTRDHIDLSTITLTDNKVDYLLHIEYSETEKRYRFSAYKKKE